jgi:hypothetical protein
MTIPSSNLRALLIFLFLCLLASPLAFGDSVTPCQTGLLTSVENTSCNIGNLVFTFGSATGFAAETIFAPSSATTGFTITGATTIGGGSFNATLLSLQLSIATMSGNTTIFGLDSALTGTIAGGGGFILGDFFGCPSNQTLGSPCILPVPVASLQGAPGVDIVIRSSPGGPTTFRSGIFQISQVPELPGAVLFVTGVIMIPVIPFLRRSSRRQVGG